MKCSHRLVLVALVVASLAAATTATDCPAYEEYAREQHEPVSTGRYKFPYQRPSQECRSYVVPEVESVIKDMKQKVYDPDLYRLFVNTWPNTVDTTVLWHGTSADNDLEEVLYNKVKQRLKKEADTSHVQLKKILLLVFTDTRLNLAYFHHYWRHQRHVASR